MKRILIIRPSALGDVVMASGILPVLRQAYPDAYLAWLADPAVDDLLRHNPNLDEVILWPKNHWKNLLRQGHLLTLGREVRQLAGTLRVKCFDMALDAQGLFRSRMLARLSAARRRIGFDSREPGRFLMTQIISRGPATRYMGSEYGYMMQALGLSAQKFHPDLSLSAKDCEEAALKKRRSGIEGRYAVMCPFTTRPQKHWFDNRWAQLSQLIEEEMGLAVLILGGPGDIAHGRRIRSLAPATIHDLTGQTTLGQSAAIIKESTLVIGVDTGLTHMGTAFDRPTVALFGATCPYRYTSGNLTTVIYHAQHCSPCKRRPICRGDFICMKSIEAAQVFEAAHRLTCV